MKFCGHILTRDGVLYLTTNADFLALILHVKAQKRRFGVELPHERLRVKLFYPNGDRVASADIRSALQALADPVVLAAVTNRSAAGLPRSGGPVADGGSAGFVGCGFRQAGVVAPPDSLTGETRPVFAVGQQGA